MVYITWPRHVMHCTAKPLLRKWALWSPGPDLNSELTAATVNIPTAWGMNNLLKMGEWRGKQQLLSRRIIMSRITPT